MQPMGSDAPLHYRTSPELILLVFLVSFLFVKGLFKDKKYFDVVAEYCKSSATDILGRYTVKNCGPETAVVHVLPTLWFRNVWSWGQCDVS